MIEKPPDPSSTSRIYHPSDNVDGKMFGSKSSRVLQEHVSDRNKTNLSHHSGSKQSGVGGTGYKENLVIQNYSASDQLICDRNTGITYVRGRLLGKVRFGIVKWLYNNLADC